MSLAATLLDAVGGPSNIAAFTRCWARLRFELHDPSLVQQERINALPQVAIAVHQQGQYQIALKKDLIGTYDAIEELLASGA